MKKRIAVFGCGWSNEYLMVVSEIFKEFAEQHQMDLYECLRDDDAKMYQMKKERGEKK